jgi:hypothetical protein
MDHRVIVGRPVRDLALALAVLTAAGAGLTLLVASVLKGPAAMQGSARGTALALLVVGVPALLVCLRLAAGGSHRAALVLLGVAAYVAYNSVLFLFATPFNSLFLLYVAMLSSSLATIAALVSALPVRDLPALFDRATPVRGIAAYLWIVVLLNTLLWLRGVVPGSFHPDDPAFLRGTGLTTSPVYVQDLSLWLPLAAVAAWWLWHRQGWGFLTVGAILTMWVAEGVSVGTDQWLGSRTDPSSTVVSASLVLPFYVLAVVGCIPLVLLLRHLRPEPS